MAEMVVIDINSLYTKYMKHHYYIGIFLKRVTHPAKMAFPRNVLDMERTYFSRKYINWLERDDAYDDTAIFNNVDSNLFCGL